MEYLYVFLSILVGLFMIFRPSFCWNIISRVFGKNDARVGESLYTLMILIGIVLVIFGAGKGLSIFAPFIRGGHYYF